MIMTNVGKHLTLGAAVVALSACSVFGGKEKLTPLTGTSTNAVTLRWQTPIGANGGPGFRPIVVGGVAYAAGVDGTIIAADAATGAQKGKFNAGSRLSAGVGSDGKLIVVATDKGQVIALDTVGAKKWTAQVSSEVISPPYVGDGMVVTVSGDGTVTGIDAANGDRKWSLPRTQPALVVRNNAGMMSTRRAGFLGTAGGRMIAFDIVTGTLGWDSTVATPKGTTELDRIADVISMPTYDEGNVCVSAYQGRTACYDLLRGTTVWARDISSRFGTALDASHFYLTDDKHVLYALDKSTGATVWKQDALAGRRISGPIAIDGKVMVFDAAGAMHLIDAKQGTLLGHSNGDAAQLPTQPGVVANGAMIWQTMNGRLIAAAPAR